MAQFKKGMTTVVSAQEKFGKLKKDLCGDLK
jgi:hypothetical protein